ncbi:MAG: DUF192 domain-containing protein [Gemmatimonadota bacterium]|nr:DUF192 domain-containing protein [Gemmatimonadota bacterium]MDH3425017.1 DUF192 domain-containing protein [Gemmatimonadota bacterium]
METVSVVHQSSGVGIGSSVAVAASWWQRLRGLLARPRLARGEGLLLLECDSVHTVGMAYPIDVAFLDADGRVVRSIEGLAPWRLGLGGAEAVHTLELPPGRLEETGTVPGTRLIWS